jgi:hypothetical protein
VLCIQTRVLNVALFEICSCRLQHFEHGHAS